MTNRGYHLSETVGITLFTYFEVAASWIGERLDIRGKCQIFKWKNKIKQYRNQQTLAYKNTAAAPFTWLAEEKHQETWIENQGRNYYKSLEAVRI
jgi:hypothetical protein